MILISSRVIMVCTCRWSRDRRRSPAAAWQSHRSDSRDCPNDIIDLINDCTTFAPVRHPPIHTSLLTSLPPQPQQKSAKHVDQMLYVILCIPYCRLPEQNSSVHPVVQLPVHCCVCFLHRQDARPSAREVFCRLHASCAAHIDGFEAAAAEAGGSGLLDTLPEPYG